MSKTFLIRFISVLLVALVVCTSPVYAATVPCHTDITYSKSALHNMDNEMKVEWRQRLQDLIDQYILVESKSLATGGNQPLFVSKGSIEEFEEKSECEAKTCKIRFDQTFSYGKQASGKGRFLVYHDQANRPFQHQFRTPEAVKIIKRLTDSKALSGGIPIVHAIQKELFNVAKSSFGKHLKTCPEIDG